MIITFKNKAKEVKGEALLVSVSPKNKDEIVKDLSAQAGNGIKTLYLKCDGFENQ